MFRPESPAAALGLAVNYLMAKPAFASRLRVKDFVDRHLRRAA